MNNTKSTSPINNQKMNTQEFICPISQTIMSDPVIAPDGHTYERQNIQEWLTHKQISPLTRQPMNNDNLIPNIALRNLIQEWKKNNPDKTIIPSENPNPQQEEGKQINIEAKKPVYNIQAKQSLHNLTQITINSKDTSNFRRPSYILTIVDVSLSMDERVDNNVSDKEQSGFSRLDLVKHTLNSIKEVLTSYDHFGIITYSQEAKIFLPFTRMTDIEKQRTSDIIQNMATEYTTNIYDGVRKAIEMIELSNINHQENNIGCIILTDGNPNIEPPRGTFNTLQKQIQETSIQYPIHTIGYGYNIGSQLLQQLSTFTGGVFGFIPDSTMLGTVFVNLMAHITSSSINMVKIKSDDIQTCYGSVRMNDKLDIYLKDYDDFEVLVDDEPVQIEKVETQLNEQLEINARFTLQKILGEQQRSNKHKLWEEMYAMVRYFDSPWGQALKDDIFHEELHKGQYGKATETNDNYQKWGIHYLRSSFTAHRSQVCMNFKDLSLQLYKSKLFEEQQERLENAFQELPPPKPTYIRISDGVSGSRSINMRTFYNQSGGCFSGDAIIRMAYNSGKLVKDVNVGDIIMTNTTGRARIKYIVKFKPKQRIDLCHIGYKEGIDEGFLITPWHPIKDQQGTWVFPKEIKRQLKQKEFNNTDEYLYDFVLELMDQESQHAVILNDIEVVTLGHGKQDNDVVYHEFFGNMRYVLQDLEEFKQIQNNEGSQSGIIKVNGVKRDEQSLRVCGFSYEPVQP